MYICQFSTARLKSGENGQKWEEKSRKGENGVKWLKIENAWKGSKMHEKVGKWKNGLKWVNRSKINENEQK